MTESDVKELLRQKILEQQKQIFKDSNDIQRISNPDINLVEDMPTLAQRFPQISGSSVSEMSAMRHIPPMDGSLLSVRLELIYPETEIILDLKRLGAEIHIAGSEGASLEATGDVSDLELSYLQMLHEGLEVVSRLTASSF